MTQMTLLYWLFQFSGRVAAGVAVWIICKFLKKLWRRMEGKS